MGKRVRGAQGGAGAETCCPQPQVRGWWPQLRLAGVVQALLRRLVPLGPLVWGALALGEAFGSVAGAGCCAVLYCTVGWKGPVLSWGLACSQLKAVNRNGK